MKMIIGSKKHAYFHASVFKNASTTMIIDIKNDSTIILTNNLIRYILTNNMYSN